MRFSQISFALLASSVAAVPYTPATAERRPSDRQILKAIAGTYTLLNTSSTLNGEPIPDAAYGKNPVGVLIYTASGYMSATITATEPEFRPALTFPYKENDTDADWAAVGRHSLGYSGPVRVNSALPANETSGQVFHGPLIVANVPTWANESQPRNYTIIERKEDGKVAKYLKIGSQRGGGYGGTLWWKRLD